MEQIAILDGNRVAGRPRPWQAYVFAMVVTFVTLGLRIALEGQLSGRPTLIVFTVPIILSAYAGGLRAGLLATALSYFGASYYLLPPIHSFRVFSVADRWDLFFLVLAGVVISALNEALHRARRRSEIAAREVQTRSALVKVGVLQSAIFNSTKFSCIATDAKGIIQIFNVGAEQMFGYTAAEVTNKITPADLHDPQEVVARTAALSLEFATPITPGFEALVFKAARGLKDIFEVTKIRKDGSRFPATVSITALRDAEGGIIGYLLIGTDNTARKRAEEDRKRFFALSQDVLCILGFDGYFKDLNPAWEKTLGYTRAEVLATPFIEFVHPDDRQATLAEAEKVSSGKALIAFENRYRCKDGSYRWFQWSVTPVIEDRVMYGVARDITERRQEEAALLKAGALQSAIFNSANFSSIATDAKGVIQIFNVGAERMLGYAAAEVLNKITPAEISDPQEVIARAKALSHELDTTIAPGFEALVFKASRGIEDIYELTYIRKDGTRFPAIVSVTALRDSRGGIIGYLLIGTDNTARKRAEEALLKAGALQNAIFNSANFSSIATDEKGVIQIFNVGAERMLGYAAADVMNKITPADISDPQEVIVRAKVLNLELSTSISPGFEALVFKASRGIEDIYELTYIRKDGTRFPAVVSVTALRDSQGGIIGYLLIGTDNTARKRAEEALLKAGALQNAIFKSANFSCIATDAKGVIQLFNVGAERMLGFTTAEVVNKITPAELHDPQEVIARAKALSLELGTPITPGFEALAYKASRGIEDIYELTKIRKNGSRFPAVVSVTALRDAQDGIIGYLLIGTDNTARQVVEQERKRFEQALQQTNVELENARFTAEKANLAKSDFLSSMSHELRTPLNAILGFAQLMESGSPSPTASQTKSITRILHAGWYLLKLIDEILDLAVIESGKVSMSKEAVSLSEIMSECRSMMEPQAQKRGIRMIFPEFGAAAFVSADRTRLKQIIINLVSNAIKYNKEQGTVVVDYAVSGPGRIRVSVKDTGAGLPPEKVAQLFQPFNRLGEEAGSVAGIGIGLVVSKRLAELMGASSAWKARSEWAVHSGANWPWLKHPRLRPKTEMPRACSNRKRRSARRGVLCSMSRTTRRTWNWSRKSWRGSRT